MIYTTTALPSYKESLRHELHSEDSRGCGGTSPHISTVQYLVKGHSLGLTRHRCLDDWLEFSSSVLSELIGDLYGR